jgi:glycosyltransferase involved in cell wall biosynthesis
MGRLLVDGYIYSRSRFGGVVRYYDNLVTHLVDLGATVDLLIEKPLPDHNSLRALHNCGVEFVSDIEHNYDAFLASYYSVASCIKPRVLTVHDLIDELLPEQMPASARWTDWEYGLSKRTAISAADRIIAVSHTTKSDLVRIYGVPPPSVITIYHGIERTFLHASDVDKDYHRAEVSRFGLPSLFVLYVGGRDGYKNFAKLLTAFGIADLPRSFALVAVGSQKEFSAEEQKIISRDRLAGRVLLMGFVTDTVLASLYSCTSLVVMPSLYEGFGLPLIEALSCGARVACSRAPSFVEIGGGFPFLFNADNEEAIAKVISQALSSNEPERWLHAKSYARQFTWPRAARCVKTVLGI